MRQEVTSETSDITIIVVEPGDERAHILTSLAQLVGRRIVVVLPDDTVFYRPADLRELEQTASHVNSEFALVIGSNERLRLWARAQGFTVFSSLETCVRSLSLPISAPKTSGQFKVPGVPITRSRITEPLYARSVAPRVLTSALSQSSTSCASMHTNAKSVDLQPADLQFTDTPVDIQLIDVQKALDKQIAKEKAQDYLLQPFSLLSNISVSLTETQLEAVDQLPTRGRTIWPDRLLFILVALLALGIMGGLGFGYLLSLAHSTTLLPASLAFVDQVVYL